MDSEDNELKRYSYIDRDGNFDYRRYVAIQADGNKRKINSQWVDEASIAYLAKYILEHYGKPNFGICHGTRRGLEQLWFRKYLDCEVIGTEISDSATQFAHTIQWDFHEIRPEWTNSVDFIYSNSWDHSYDPECLFNSWMSCLRPSGLCIVEHNRADRHINELDCLGMELPELREFLVDLGQGRWELFDEITGGPPVRTNSHKPERKGAQAMIAVSYLILRKF